MLRRVKNSLLRWAENFDKILILVIKWLRLGPTFLFVQNVVGRWHIACGGERGPCKCNQMTEHK